MTPIWPPTGIALVALLVIGRRAWPAIALAAFAVNLPIGPSPLGAALIAAGNTLAPLVAVELLRRVDFRVELDRLRDAIALVVIGALAGMTISATVGSTVLLVSGAIVAANFWSTWAVWWTGDAMGVLLVGPFLLSLLKVDLKSAMPWGRGIELAGLLAATGIVTYLVFQSRLGIQYLVLPLIMAAAWRFRLAGASPAALIASGVAIWSAIEGTGPFFGEPLFQKMVILQAFNVSVALTSFLLASFVDTHERQEETARLLASSRLAGEAKTRFLHMAAHELRTPISVVAGYLSLLSDGSFGPGPDKWKRAIEILTTKTRELNTIVSDLLEASRLEANALPRLHEQVDLRSVVQDAAARARPRASLLKAEIVTDVRAEAVPVDGDPQQLGRVLDNLINNGLTYTTRVPRLMITVSSEATQGVVRVADNGAGIPEHERERVFERFHRTNEPPFRNVAGTGLGLFISRQLAEGHGGHLSIESSRPEEGTVFALTLPLSSSAPASASGPAEDQALAVVNSPRAGSSIG